MRLAFGLTEDRPATSSVLSLMVTASSVLWVSGEHPELSCEDRAILALAGFVSYDSMFDGLIRTRLRLDSRRFRAAAI